MPNFLGSLQPIAFEWQAFPSPSSGGEIFRLNFVRTGTQGNFSWFLLRRSDSDCVGEAKKIYPEFSRDLIVRLPNVGDLYSIEISRRARFTSWATLPPISVSLEELWHG